MKRCCLMFILLNGDLTHNILFSFFSSFSWEYEWIFVLGVLHSFSELCVNPFNSKYTIFHWSSFISTFSCVFFFLSFFAFIVVSFQWLLFLTLILLLCMKNTPVQNEYTKKTHTILKYHQQLNIYARNLKHIT